MARRRKSSTSLMVVKDRLPEEAARAMYDWRRLFGGAPQQAYLRSLDDGGIDVDFVDVVGIDPAASYLVVELESGRIVGTIRDGELISEPERLLPSRTRCTLFVAAKA